MRFAVYWTGVFTILLIVSEKAYSRNCYEPIDYQCFIGCYYYHGSCEECTNCTRDQLVDIVGYHRKECIFFPAFCKRQTSDINWREYATDFHPLNLPSVIIGSFIGYFNQWHLVFFQEVC
ncbi:hypothetical protein HOLleu_18671 [Holothuria leucospilota]|uniref:TNFR-Cys domain-containing protein n=1 Tax=Holothuria leucospilota TaxID=206669 RepID=A0A9Q1C266_HOLLE|nr:hypothetical protein HOLleu_18671 [Holothuria leucospilota]